GRSAGGNRRRSRYDRGPLSPHVHGSPHRRWARGGACRGTHRLRAPGRSIARSGCWELTRANAGLAFRPTYHLGPIAVYEVPRRPRAIGLGRSAIEREPEHGVRPRRWIECLTSPLLQLNQSSTASPSTRANSSTL